MRKRIFIIVFILVSLYNTSYSQWASLYNYGINTTDYPTGIALDQSGNTYVCGCSFSTAQESNYILIKYNLSGDTVWSRQYNGNISGEDESNEITIDNQSNVLITGRSESSTGYDIYTIKYSSSGDVLWSKRFNGSGSGSNASYSIETDDSLNVYIAGKIETTVNVYAISLIKYNKSGVMQWAKQFNGNNTGTNIPNAMTVNGISGNIYLTGYISTLNQGKDIVILKYNRNGSLIWQKIINGSYNSDDIGNSISTDSDENVYFTGSVTIGANNNTDFITSKYNSAGDSLWSVNYSGASGGTDISRAVTVDNLGNSFVTGESYSGSGSVTNEIATICYSSSGIIKWISKYNNNNNCCDHIPVSLASDQKGNIIVSGKSTGISNFNDFIVLKYNNISGTQSGVYRYRFQGTNDNDVKSIAIDKNGSCYLTGLISSTGAINIGTVKVINSAIGIENITKKVQGSTLSLTNYPNPFNSFTKIKFEVSAPGNALLEITDLSGKSIFRILKNGIASGSYEYLWDAASFPSGIYFCRLTSGKFTLTKKIILMK